ncbi:PLP-dependent aminotransferase family protein [Candidatus Roizmanbacteria bacterium]|nr:PLP-dependent aminotransferase family protein [Candidatus Roizmanbacteria bacterium]
MNITNLLAERTNRMSGSIIREILKATADSRLISLAGGLPAAETFPIETIHELHQIIVKKYGPSLFQYGPTEGFTPFREAIVDYVKRRHIVAKMEEIFITSGSQGALDAVGKICINKGDRVAVESPTYLGALSAFNPYEPEYVEIETDAEGIVPESLEEILKTQKVKFTYLNPTFQNPTGRTLSFKRRKQVAEILKKYDALAIEDDPYGELRYSGIPVPSIKSMAPDQVIYMSTFSKVFAPGFRLGFFVAPPKLGSWLTIAKQGVDLHTSSYGQALATEYLVGGHLDKQIPQIIALYKPRQQALLDALKKHLSWDEFTWTQPEGGMFVWVEAPARFDTEKVYWEAIKQFVAFVPGVCFYAKQDRSFSTMRLNFTNVNEATISAAVEKIAQVFKNFEKTV